MDSVPDAIPWYKSNVLRALLMGGVAFGLKKVGLADQFPDTSGIVDKALDGAQVAAGLWAAYARVKKPNPQVTMTKASADAANAPKSPLIVALILLMMLAAAIGSAPLGAQTLKFTVAQTVNPNGSVTPALTWCTETTVSTGATCSGSGPASACIASGDWTGTKGAAGAETLAAITVGKSYVLQCNWPGKDAIALTWLPPTKNDDGSALTDLAGFHIVYGTSPTMSANQVKDVPGAGVTSASIGPGLAPGTWYIVMDAYNTAKVMSVKAPSPPLQKTLTPGLQVSQSVKVTFPNAPTGLTVQ